MTRRFRHGPRVRPTQILHVEDNPADVELLREAASLFPRLSVTAVSNGVEALEYLRHQNGYATAPTPDVILLDLDLPVVDGRRVLMEVKADAALRVIPVIVLSGSTAPDDLFCAYSLGANAYVPKPVRLRQLRRVVRAIYQFWCVAVARPEAR